MKDPASSPDNNPRNAPPAVAKPVFDPLTAEPVAPRSDFREVAKVKAEAKSKSAHKWTMRLVEMGILLFGVLLVLILRWGVYETAIVTSGSMETTLRIEDRILVDHRTSLHGTWQRGDIVFFKTPPNWGDDNDTLVKRVIGLPGEIVEIRAGGVYIDGQKLDEPYIKEKDTSTDVYGPFPPLKPGHYWLMGDNRNKSDDSRYNGPVEDKYMTGRGVRIIWPLSNMGYLSRPDYGS